MLFPGLTGNSVLSTYCVLLLCRVNLKSKWLLHFGGSQSRPAANSFLESLLLLPATFSLFSVVLIFLAFFPYLFLPSLFSPSLFLAYFLLGIFFLPPSSNNCGACLHQLTIMQFPLVRPAVSAQLGQSVCCSSGRGAFFSSIEWLRLEATLKYH